MSATPSLDPDGASFRNLADPAPVMIWMSGLDLGCFYFNRAWLDYRGRTLEQERGNGWAEGVHPDELDTCVAHYTSCFQAQTPFAMNYRLQHRSGEYYWILDRGAPHYSPEGTFLGFFGGCAEVEDLEPSVLNSQLRSSLAGAANFAREMAQKALATPASAGEGTPPLKFFAQNLRRERIATHAAQQLKKLAADMLTYGGIPRGACLR